MMEAAEIGGDFVYSRKPNPAFVATVRYQPERLSQWADIAMQVAGGNM
ncbi:hypothetical protein ACFL01_02955 [Planctomycetota bacterium]